MLANEVNALIKKLSPFMEEDSEIFRELMTFFGQGSKIDVHHGDLSKFLGHKRLYRVIRLKGESYKDCVYQLVDNYPESMEALGMLRYYKAPTGPVRWEEVEAAEIAIGKELTMAAYGWMPDAWTLFEKGHNAEGNEGGERTNAGEHELVAILAFDLGE
ncbi:MAG: hypothetical protein IKP03_09450 [Fibrobacter sp.]|nr:hypothetical protein [Fibrobacter sp.]